MESGNDCAISALTRDKVSRAMPRQCPDRDIRITPSGETITVRFAGRIVAQTADALDMAEGRYPIRVYVPVADVDPTVLKASSHHTTCPFKGVASYYSLKAEDETAENAVWYYPDPCPQVAAIKDRVAFCGDRVEIIRR
jgi:uncharacterized protein (DUF427 family)